MTPFLVGGALIYLVGCVMLLAAAFEASVVWGVAGLLVPPLQWLFGLLNWRKAWDALLMQFFGLAMVGAFFLQAGEFSMTVVQQAWTQFQRQYVQQGQSPAGPVEVKEQPVVQAEPQAPVELGSDSITSVSVPVVAAPEKEKNDKPIYKCTDPQGNETWSTQPCKGSTGPAPGH